MLILPKKFALIGGVLMLAMGILSLFPQLRGPVDALPVLRFEASYGLFAGILPLNIVNKLALIIFGAAGLVAANQSSQTMAVTFSRYVAVVMGAAALLGAIPFTNTFFGYWPLFGNEVTAHALFALIGAYFGFIWKPKVLQRNNRVYIKNRSHRQSIEKRH